MLLGLSLWLKSIYFYEISRLRINGNLGVIVLCQGRSNQTRLAGTAFVCLNLGPDPPSIDAYSTLLRRPSSGNSLVRSGPPNADQSTPFFLIVFSFHKIKILLNRRPRPQRGYQAKDGGPNQRLPNWRISCQFSKSMRKDVAVFSHLRHSSSFGSSGE